MSHAKSAERVVRDIQRKTRRRFSAEEKIRIILEGLRGEESIASLCRREGLNPNLYYRWSKEFLEAGKKRLLGDTTREATSTEVADVWNRIPPRVRQRVVDAALADPEQSPRELAWHVTDREGHFLSESSVYRILKAYDLILRSAVGSEDVPASDPAAA